MIIIEIEDFAQWFMDNYIMLFFKVLKEQDKDKVKEHQNALKKVWETMNKNLSENGANSGLFLKSGQVSFFEIIAWPFFERAIVLETLAFTPLLSKWMNEFKRIQSWYNTVSQLYIIKKNRQKDVFFLLGYAGYAGKKAEDIVKKLKQK